MFLLITIVVSTCTVASAGGGWVGSVTVEASVSLGPQAVKSNIAAARRINPWVIVLLFIVGSHSLWLVGVKKPY